jgi:hypothetical protein
VLDNLGSPVQQPAQGDLLPASDAQQLPVSVGAGDAHAAQLEAPPSVALPGVTQGVAAQGHQDLEDRTTTTPLATAMGAIGMYVSPGALVPMLACVLVITNRQQILRWMRRSPAQQPAVVVEG